MTLKMVIDTDPGIDDAMAILYALSDPGIDLLGLTTVFGNVPVSQATRNALGVLAHVGAEVAVAEGAARPSVQPPQPHPDFVHGADGLGGAVPQGTPAAPDPRDAASFLIDTVKADPGEVTLVPVGPLTNLAEALERAPEIADLAREVIIMGGAVQGKGNISPHAEANIWQDPHAAEQVLSATWPVRMIGLDVTEQVRCVPEDFETLAAARPGAGGFLARALPFYMRFHAQNEGFHGCYMHDPTAVISAVCPEHFGFEPHPLLAVCEGEEIGATRPATDGRAAVEAALTVDAEAVRRRFLDVIATGPLP
ncbi:MAG: nucleoside hydrolase [Pseudomonadota bacterium]